MSDPFDGPYSRRLCSPRRKAARTPTASARPNAAIEPPPPHHQQDDSGLDPLGALASPPRVFAKTNSFSSSTSSVNPAVVHTRSPLRKQHSDADRFVPVRSEMELSSHFKFVVESSSDTTPTTTTTTSTTHTTPTHPQTGLATTTPPPATTPTTTTTPTTNPAQTTTSPPTPTEGEAVYGAVLRAHFYANPQPSSSPAGLFRYSTSNSHHNHVTSPSHNSSTPNHVTTTTTSSTSSLHHHHPSPFFSPSPPSHISTVVVGGVVISSSVSSVVGGGALPCSSTTSPLRSSLVTWCTARSPTPKHQRKISTTPYKILDAPNLQDDFYLNLVDWSCNNVLAVALGSHVYLWNAFTGKVTKCYSTVSASDTPAHLHDTVTSVAWVQKGTHLAIGTGSGKVDIVDTVPCKKVRTMTGHSNRVGTLCWNGPVLTSGSRDRLIINRDTTSPEHFTAKLHAHKQEVCGLKWSPDGKYLASGGNDNKLLLWSRDNTFKPVFKYSEHSAAVKAIAWSPHESDILVSGGGTADRRLRFWNVHERASFKVVDTGSQVCNLGWSQNVNEIVSTHGYSQNQIVIWRYPSMTRVATLAGHTTRVLYLAVSPDGQNVVTGAGDETLRFWHVWPGKKSKEESQDGKGTLPFSETQIR